MRLKMDVRMVGASKKECSEMDVRMVGASKKEYSEKVGEANDRYHIF